MELRKEVEILCSIDKEKGLELGDQSEHLEINERGWRPTTVARDHSEGAFTAVSTSVHLP
jgi:hypothetical protein